MPDDTQPEDPDAEGKLLIRGVEKALEVGFEEPYRRRRDAVEAMIEVLRHVPVGSNADPMGVLAEFREYKYHCFSELKRPISESEDLDVFCWVFAKVVDTFYESEDQRLKAEEELQRVEEAWFEAGGFDLMVNRIRFSSERLSRASAALTFSEMDTLFFPNSWRGPESDRNK